MQQPTQAHLLNTLISICNGSYRTYLIMDALDECSERKELFHTVRQIISKGAGRVSVLVTSREERDIADGMEGVISDSIDLECRELDADIELHICKGLASDTDWQNTPLEVKLEIQDALVNRSNGM
jgi:hypothetical protein